MNKLISVFLLLALWLPAVRGESLRRAARRTLVVPLGSMSAGEFAASLQRLNEGLKVKASEQPEHRLTLMAPGCVQVRVGDPLLIEADAFVIWMESLGLACSYGAEGLALSAGAAAQGTALGALQKPSSQPSPRPSPQPFPEGRGGIEKAAVAAVPAPATQTMAAPTPKPAPAAIKAETANGSAGDVASGERRELQSGHYGTSFRVDGTLVLMDREYSFKDIEINGTLLFEKQAVAIFENLAVNGKTMLASGGGLTAKNLNVRGELVLGQGSNCKAEVIDVAGTLRLEGGNVCSTHHLVLGKGDVVMKEGSHLVVQTISGS